MQEKPLNKCSDDFLFGFYPKMWELFPKKKNHETFFCSEKTERHCVVIQIKVPSYKACHNNYILQKKV